jgi:hypothetical protein
MNLIYLVGVSKNCTGPRSLGKRTVSGYFVDTEALATADNIKNHNDNILVENILLILSITPFLLLI